MNLKRKALSFCRAAAGAVVWMALGGLLAVAWQGHVLKDSMGKVRHNISMQGEALTKVIQITRAYRGEPIRTVEDGGVTAIIDPAGKKILTFTRTESVLLKWTLEDRAAGRIQTQVDQNLARSARGFQIDQAMLADREEGKVPLAPISSLAFLSFSRDKFGGWADDPEVEMYLAANAYQDARAANTVATYSTYFSGMAQCALTAGIDDGCGGFLGWKSWAPFSRHGTAAAASTSAVVSARQ